jgi:hypothetical protein
MAQEASLIFSLAFELRDLYEKKALNKSKVKYLLHAVDQICEYLQTYYSLIVAEFPGHLQRLEFHVRAASDWCKSYVKSSSFSKTFNSAINGKTSDELRTAMMDCLQGMTAHMVTRNTSLLMAPNARHVPEVSIGLPAQGDEPPLLEGLATREARAASAGPCALEPMAQEASLIFSLAFELRDLYEKKALNKSKVKYLLDAVDQICEYLQTYYSLIVAEFPGHLQRLEGHVREASDWCKSYVKSSSFSKTFNSNINGKGYDELRSAMMDCFHVMSLDVGLRVTSLWIASNARPVPEVPVGDEPPFGI